VKPQFLTNRQGKDFCLYAGLLDQAHQEGLKRISTTLIQIPSDANGFVAICHAEVETEKGTFSGIGDASPQNVGKMIVLHLIRMAETRAKARALRDAINVGVTALEETDDDDGAHTPAFVQRQPQAAPRQQAPIPIQRQSPAVPTPSPSPTRPKPSPNDPAPDAWLAELRKLAADLREATGDVHDIPADLTRGNARAMKEMLVTALAESLFPPIEPKPVASDVAELALAEGAGV
jgi:hypothetical protein